MGKKARGKAEAEASRAAKQESRRQKRHRVKVDQNEQRRDIRGLEEQLYPLGLCIKYVEGDGNCLFRAFSHQMDGTEGNHRHFREAAVSTIVQNKILFENFIEDDETFEEYVDSMRTDGTWGGQIEIQALSMCFDVNISIYQRGQTRWDIVNNMKKDARTVHLAYHLGEHYNSVKSTDGVDPTRKGNAVGSSTGKGQTSAPEDADYKSRLILQSCPDVSEARVMETLEIMDFDVESTIEYLLQEPDSALPEEFSPVTSKPPAAEVAKETEVARAKDRPAKNEKKLSNKERKKIQRLEKNNRKNMGIPEPKSGADEDAATDMQGLRL